eukprot:gene15104-16662_t
MDLKEKGIVILLISGKRKAGKDFIAEKIYQRLGIGISLILRISAPLKSEYAKMHSLEYDRLLDSSHYKESYRLAMVKWGEEKRRCEPEYFCKQLIPEGIKSGKLIWIISDIRRRTDIQFFDQFDNVKLRITANEDTRLKRGWNFIPGIDDSETEVDLDSYKHWDFVVENNGDMINLEKYVHDICNHLCFKLKKNKP